MFLRHLNITLGYIHKETLVRKREGVCMRKKDTEREREREREREMREREREM